MSVAHLSYEIGTQNHSAGEKEGLLCFVKKGRGPGREPSEESRLAGLLELHRERAAEGRFSCFY